MIYVLCALIVTQIALVAAIAVFAWVKFTRLQRTVTEFMVPQEAGKPSAMAQTWEAMADMLARTLTARITTAIMTGSSAMTRAGKAVEGDIALDIASAQSPLLAGILDNFPNLKRTLRRNPALMDLGMQALTKALSGAGSAKPAAAAAEGSQESPVPKEMGRINRR